MLCLVHCPWHFRIFGNNMFSVSWLCTCRAVQSALINFILVSFECSAIFYVVVYNDSSGLSWLSTTLDFLFNLGFLNHKHIKKQSISDLVHAFWSCGTSNTGGEPNVRHAWLTFLRFLLKCVWWSWMHCLRMLQVYPVIPNDSLQVFDGFPCMFFKFNELYACSLTFGVFQCFLHM